MKILIFLIALFVITASIVKPETSGEDRLNSEIKGLREENSALRRENNSLKKYENDIMQIDERIATLKTQGYMPDRLLIRQIQLLSKQLSIEDDFAINVLKTESSLWAPSQLSGALGEAGGFQILPSTMIYYLKLFGVDTSGMDDAFIQKNYSDIKTNSAFAYIMFLEMRQNKGRLKWKDWNVGWQR